MGRLEGKSAVVTGGTKGIGLAIARALLKRSAKVFICARNDAEVEATVAELKRGYGPSVLGAVCDVRDYEQVQALFAEAGRAFDGLDVLINNAGVGSFNNVEQMPADEWRTVIETNLSGVFYCCHEAIPLMKGRGGGYIINIGSLAGKNAFAGAAAYCASKFGLIGFSEALMQEVRYDHIRVSYVMPGSVNTGFGRHGEEDAATTWKLLPEDVAQVVVGLLEMDPRALPSRVELRPSEPKK
ncbi:MAG TPA: SDR family oxidoreductase [Blastocatellia bacterium]|nr:SDR family oxidoreductase [Blastocatellia bacterium]